LKKDCGIAKEY